MPGNVGNRWNVVSRMDVVCCDDNIVCAVAGNISLERRYNVRTVSAVTGKNTVRVKTNLSELSLVRSWVQSLHCRL